MQGPSFGSDVTETVQWQVDALSNADPSEASQQESIRIQVVGAAQFLLKSLIIFPATGAWADTRDEQENLRG